MAGLGALIGIVGPVFLVILIGFGIGRSGILTPDLVRGIGRFIIAVPLPALVFNALATARIGEVFRKGDRCLECVNCNTRSRTGAAIKTRGRSFRKPATVYSRRVLEN